MNKKERAGCQQSLSSQLIRVVGVIGLGLAGGDPRIITFLAAVEGVVGTDAARR